MLSIFVAALVTSASPTPGKLVKTVNYNDLKYRFYLVQDKGPMRFRVCVRYKAQSMRVTRDTCRSQSASKVSTGGNLRITAHKMDRHEALKGNAKVLEQVANQLVKDQDLSKEDIKKLYKFVRQGHENPEGFTIPSMSGTQGKGSPRSTRQTSPVYRRGVSR